MKMKGLNYLPVAALCFMAASCAGGGQQDGDPTAGINLSYMDTTQRAGTDFYQYATGGWQKQHPLPAEYSRYGNFDQLAETNQKRINEIIQEIAPLQNEPGSNAQKIADFYNTAMDSTKLNADGYNPIKQDLDDLDAAVTDAKSVYSLLPQLARKGVSAYFGVYIGADEKDSKNNALQISQGGLSMANRDYYIKDEDPEKSIREAFKQHVQKMFTLTGHTDAEAQQAVSIVMDIETRMAQAFRSNVELRDPEANYNKMTLDELKKQYPSADWNGYFNAMGISGVKDVIVGQPASLKASVDIIASLPADQQRTYLEWKLINAAAPYLSDDLEAEDFDFYSRTMSGVQQQQPRWKRTVSNIDRTLGMAVGQLYVEKYFPAEAKQRMVELVGNLQKSLGQRIDQLTWMSDTTKTRAHEKLDTFKVKIGYPDKWKDYSSMDIGTDSYWDNMKSAAAWEYDDMISRFGKPVDAEEWFMTPQTVNAYYNPTTNEICFPAGILQYPFFDMEADDAFNYGAIGVVIGHEMTHGFDDQGRQYDKDGNLSDWWTAADAQKFTERAQVIINTFDNIEVAPGLHGNGSLTQGENIADHGGLKVAFQAFKNATADSPLPVKDGFTPEQRFYLAYAALWAQNIRPEEIQRRTKVDPHALGKWRVDAQVAQLQTWYDAFGITPSDPMYVAPENRVDIW